MDIDITGLHLNPMQAATRVPDQGRRIAVTDHFTNFVVLDVSSTSCCMFFCEWGAHAPITPRQKGLTTSERRSRERSGMQACGGGLSESGSERIPHGGPEPAEGLSKVAAAD